MKISSEHIRAIQSLGYSEDEARFLYIVANHSGYFVPRQFIAFTGSSWGKRSQLFTDKLERRGHVTWREYQDMGGVYHLFSKTLYRQIDRENLRNRRRHSTEFIRTRLLLLDFVLANQAYDYFESEDDKLRFFCDELSIRRKHSLQRLTKAQPRPNPRFAISSTSSHFSLLPPLLPLLWSPSLMWTPDRQALRGSRTT